MASVGRNARLRFPVPSEIYRPRITEPVSPGPMSILRTALFVTLCVYPSWLFSEPPAGGVTRKGANADWLPANKTGFGTSYTTVSNVWFTLQNGRLSEVYYPRLDTPSVRNLDFIVTDGHGFAVRAQDGSTSLTRLVNLGSRPAKKSRRMRAPTIPRA